MNTSISSFQKTTHKYLTARIPKVNPKPDILIEKSKYPSDFFNDIRGVDRHPFVFNRIGVIKTVYEIDQTRNFEDLYRFQMLEENWDGEGAKKISRDIIALVFILIRESQFLRQPQLSPLPNSGISIEFDLSRPHSLIIEVEAQVAIYSIVLKTKIGRLYFTGTISRPGDIQYLIYNFFEGKMPDGKTFKRIEQESYKHKK